jgi:hypothetical protein
MFRFLCVSAGCAIVAGLMLTGGAVCGTDKTLWWGVACCDLYLLGCIFGFLGALDNG